MGPAHLGRGAEHVGVALELPVAAAEHVAGEHHPGVGRAPHLTDVVIGVRRASDHGQLHSPRLGGRDPGERLDQQVRVVLRLQAPDEQDVLARLQAQPLERLRPIVSGILDAVGHHPDPLAVAPFEDLGHRVAVGDRLVSPARRGALGKAKVGLGEGRPLATIGVEPIDVDHGGDPRPPGDQAQRRVSRDEEQRHVGLGHPGDVRRRQCRVDERVQVLVLDRPQVDELRTLVGLERRIDDVRAAVHHHLMAALGQAGGQLLHRRLEPAVGGGNPARAEDRDLHAPRARE